jgi:hypothetical protein
VHTDYRGGDHGYPREAIVSCQVEYLSGLLKVFQVPDGLVLDGTGLGLYHD